MFSRLIARIVVLAVVCGVIGLVVGLVGKYALGWWAGSDTSTALFWAVGVGAIVGAVLGLLASDPDRVGPQARGGTTPLIRCRRRPAR